MRFAKRRMEPTGFALWVLLGFGNRLGALRLVLRVFFFALHDERNCAHDGLVLAIGDVISHGLLHKVPSFFGSRNEFRPGPPPVLRGERHGISDQGDRNQWASVLRETGLAGPGFVELPASNAAPFTEPNAGVKHSS